MSSLWHGVLKRRPCYGDNKTRRLLRPRFDRAPRPPEPLPALLADADLKRVQMTQT
jgi:hypothetical protein